MVLWPGLGLRVFHGCTNSHVQAHFGRRTSVKHRHRSCRRTHWLCAPSSSVAPSLSHRCTRHVTRTPPLQIRLNFWVRSVWCCHGGLCVDFIASRPAQSSNEQRGQLDGYLYLTSERSQVPTGRRIYKQIDNLDTKTPKNSRERAERAAPNGALWWRACGAQAHETWWHGRRKPDTWPAVETSCLIPSQFTLIPSQCVKKL